MSGVWYTFEIIGTGVFAFSGALLAGEKRMDLFGIASVAAVTALGGGTLRDLLLGRRAFWIDDPNYLIVSLIVALVAFFVLRLRLARGDYLLLLADALGLGLFTVVGVEKAMNAGAPGVAVVLLGTLTAIGGSVARDVLCGNVPLILLKEIYAMAAVAGACLYLLLYHLSVPCTVNALVCIAVVFLTRLVCFHRKTNFPYAV